MVERNAEIYGEFQCVEERANTCPDLAAPGFIVYLAGFNPCQIILGQNARLYTEQVSRVPYELQSQSIIS